MKWIKLGGLLLALCAVALVAFAFLRESQHIRSLRELTTVPTPESEPGNRASYYLAAAALVSPPPEDLTGVLAKQKIIPWQLVRPSVQRILAENTHGLDIVQKAEGLDDCRMPLLYGAGTHGGFEFKTGEALRGLGDVLYWACLDAAERSDVGTASAIGLLNLRMGRDVMKAGSFEQAHAGAHICLMASRLIAELVTRYPLDDDTLATLERGLPSCLFPPGFNEDSLIENHRQWSRLIHYDTAPAFVRIVRTLHLGRIIDTRGYNLSQPALSAHYSQAENMLMDYPRPHPLLFDGTEGINSGIILLRVAVAVRRYSTDAGKLPASLDQLVPEYLSEIPANPAGPPFEVSFLQEALEIVSPRVEWKISRRALTLRLDATPSAG